MRRFSEITNTPLKKKITRNEIENCDVTEDEDLIHLRIHERPVDLFENIRLSIDDIELIMRETKDNGKMKK